jgi:hypothetical protein
MATMPFTDADLKPVVPVAQNLFSLVQDPDAVGDTVRNETHHLQIVIEYGPEAYHIEEQDGSPYAQGGTSRCKRDSHDNKKIDAPELARDLRRVLDDVLAIDAIHLERMRRRERIETVTLLKEFLRIADVRPDTPNADYCLSPDGFVLRWKTSRPIQPRLWNLLALIMESLGSVPFRTVRQEFNWNTKSLLNRVNELNSELDHVGFPTQVSTDNQVLSLS